MQHMHKLINTDRGYPKETASSFTMRCEGLGWNPNWYPQPFFLQICIKRVVSKIQKSDNGISCVCMTSSLLWSLDTAGCSAGFRVCCSVLQRDVAWCSNSQSVVFVAVCDRVWQCVAVHCSAAHRCAAVWYSSVLQFVAVCCSMLQCVVARHFECVAMCAAVCCRP